MTGARAALFVILTLLPAAGQTDTDFSGRWTRVEASGVTDGWDVADEITIQDVANPGASGQVPFVRELRVERRTGGDVREETLSFGAGGVVGGLTAGGVPTTPVVRSEWAVRWREGRLLQWSSETSRRPDGTEQVAERAQEWWLDGDGQLVMAVRTRPAGEASRRGRLVYRRVP
jgi:hypothetical protein